MINPYVILGLVIFWIVSVGAASTAGYRYSDGQHAKEEVKRQELLNEVRAANAQFADGVAMATEEAIRKIRITNTTINREIRNEREIHRVLENPDCALPPSTVGVLNRARAGGLDDGKGSGKPAPAVPGTAAAASKGAAR